MLNIEIVFQPKLFKMKVTRHGFWFRVFGYGLSVRSAERYPTNDNEMIGRDGQRKRAYEIGPLIVKPLGPKPVPWIEPTKKQSNA